MHISKKDIFTKTWLSSVVCGVAVASVFWFVTSLGNIFSWMYKSASFVDLLILFSIAGSYFGAGYVGWRIAVKYYYCYDNRYIKYYMRYSLLSFVLLIIIIYTPLSFLGLLWSVIAPLCVLQSLAKIKKSHTH